MFSTIFTYFFQTTLKKNKSQVKSWVLILSYFSAIKFVVYVEGVGGLPNKKGLSLDSECLESGVLLESPLTKRGGFLERKSAGLIPNEVDSKLLAIRAGFPKKKSMLSVTDTLRLSLQNERTSLVKEAVFLETKESILKSLSGVEELRKSRYFRWGRPNNRKFKFVPRFTRFLVRKNLFKQKRKLLEYSKFKFRAKFLTIGVLDVYLHKFRPFHLLLLCIDKATPVISLRLKRSGGTFYRIPRPLNEHKGTKVALRWVFKHLLVRNEKRTSGSLLKSFVMIQQSEGPVIQLQTTLYKIAIQNRPFVRFLRLGK